MKTNKYFIVLIFAFLFVGCNTKNYIPADIRRPADEVKYRQLPRDVGDAIIDPRDVVGMVNGITVMGTKYIHKVRYSYNIDFPQLDFFQYSTSKEGRCWTLNRKMKWMFSGYYFLGNDTLEDKSNTFNRLKTHVLMYTSKGIGNGFVAANCVATRYIYDHSLLPKTVIYRIDGTIPDEEQMQKYITLSKLNLKSVSLSWVPTDSTLFINIKTRLLKN